ncbi:MAG: hypothetical protein N3J91_15495 [Verrucomicrobiae bacterium]|nr:hypothetical protein [Verrucomicrobiae bacterium]
MWWTLFIIVCLVIAMWGFSSFWNGVKKVRAAEQEAEKEMGGITRLSAAEAEEKAQKVLDKQALTQDWPSPPPAELDSRINQLDLALSRLLRRYRKIAFEESGTEISAELLLSGDAPAGLWLVGMNRANGYKLAVKSESPIVYEIAGSRIRERYPSIFHYFLLVESAD